MEEWEDDTERERAEGVLFSYGFSGLFSIRLVSKHDDSEYGGQDSRKPHGIGKGLTEGTSSWNWMIAINTFPTSRSTLNPSYCTSLNNPRNLPCLVSKLNLALEPMARYGVVMGMGTTNECNWKTLTMKFQVGTPYITILLPRGCVEPVSLKAVIRTIMHEGQGVMVEYGYLGLERDVPTDTIPNLAQ
ncbi:hypothetical protein PanWU01x14_217980 [Parasponia andersonii]|uniref:Uncharacterized protein n=1 Tax=Parasponia andersonii TaxID=3476 RepID=A0A2P5BR18_PARAD|nr:hypothetical protein PanWU01x14_217980 [Parasponia andersonii]